MTYDVIYDAKVLACVYLVKEYPNLVVRILFCFFLSFSNKLDNIVFCDSSVEILDTEVDVTCLGKIPVTGQTIKNS